jgi:cytochrome c oxidase subunit 1
MYGERLGQVTAVLVLVGLNVTFLPQFVMGSRGMTRRYYNYLPEFQDMHVMSTIGAYIMGLGFLLTAYCLIQSLRSGRKAPANPWGGNTLEWACSSPPPYYNFHKTPVVTEGPYDYENWTYDKKIGGYVRTDASAGA